MKDLKLGQIIKVNSCCDMLLVTIDGHYEVLARFNVLNETWHSLYRGSFNSCSEFIRNCCES